MSFHGARANAGFDVPFLDDSVCFAGVLWISAGQCRCYALPLRPPVFGQRDSDQTADVDGEFHETDSHGCCEVFLET